MTQDVEKLKLECIEVYENNIGNDGYIYAGLEAVIDHLQERGLLAMDGYVMVPREPTDEMLEAAWKQSDSHVFVCPDHSLRKGVKAKHARTYKAMITFSPVQAQETGVVAKHDEAG